MIYVVLVLLIVLLCIFVIYNKIQLNKLYDYIDLIDKEMTQLESHTDGAFHGSYSKMMELEKKFNNHCHSYVFDNGVLYIQEPIINDRTDKDINDEITE